MEGKTHVTAPHRIVDHELGRVVYGTGDAVPLEDAIKYGLVSKSEAKKLDEPTPVAAKPGRRTRHRQGPEESR